MARQFLNITYPNPDHPDYAKVIQLAREHNATKSDTGRRLVHNGLEHLNNPHPLFEDPSATSPVKVTQKKPVVRTVNPIVNSSVEHVSGKQSPTRPPRDEEADNRADREASSTVVEDKNKSLKKPKSDTGWIILACLGIGAGTWLVHTIAKYWA